MKTNLFSGTYAALRVRDPSAKVAAAQALRSAWDAGHLMLDPMPVGPISEPGRPERPLLVSPQKVNRRTIHTEEGRAASIHAIAHIEFNAINLALDAAYRFREMPQDYYGDWLKVAAEEAYHFSLLREHLQTLSYDYGDFPAHNGLWEMAVKTAHDPLVRMALVPRVLEARGLDVSPAISQKFRAIGDDHMVEILKIIQADEIGHVKIGNRWYRYLCNRRGLDPDTTFQQLLVQYDAPGLKSPFAIEARRQAGFSEKELAMLKQQP